MRLPLGIIINAENVLTIVVDSIHLTVDTHKSIHQSPLFTFFSLASRPFFSLALASILRFLNHIQLDAR
jgi:hypothetical protein